MRKNIAQAWLTKKNFMNEVMPKWIQELKKSEFKKRLKESIQQSKDGKGRFISSDELDKIIRDVE